jgi:hypothetical protein
MRNYAIVFAAVFAALSGSAEAQSSGANTGAGILDGASIILINPAAIGGP